MSVDNSDINAKIRVRQRGIALIKGPFRVLEMFAGSGNITRALWAKISHHVTAIEREPGKFTFEAINLTYQCDHNANYIDSVPLYNVIDCDAYGMVLPLLLKCIEKAKPGTAIFFTEFNPVRYSKDWVGETIKKLASHSKVSGVWYEKAANSQVIYGYAILQ